MKKVFLLAYPEVNLGDDIFVAMLLKRYPDIDFFINIPDVSKRAAFLGLKNISFIEGVSDRKDYDSIDVHKYDAFIYIGGSVFMENAWGLMDNTNINRFVLRAKELNKPFFYISSNFGPCKTQKYFDVSKSIISNCRDVCFRDKYSYELFADVPSVRYQPDLILGYDVGTVECVKNSVGISVIGFDIREELAEFSDKYYDLLENSIRSYISSGMSVVLFSFCKIECDEIGIDILLSRFSEEELSSIKVVKYDGNIDGFIDEYKNVEYMICTRFHSMILSAVCGQKLYCVSYSKKIDNVANDLNFNIEIKDIRNLDVDVIKLDDFRKVNDGVTQYCKNESKKQFEAFDKFITGE